MSTKASHDDFYRSMSLINNDGIITTQLDLPVFSGMKILINSTMPAIQWKIHSGHLLPHLRNYVYIMQTCEFE